MEEFYNMEEGWGLLNIQNLDPQSISSFGPLDIQNLDDNLSFNLPDLYEAINNNNNNTVLLNDLDAFYQPLDPIFHSFSPQEPIFTPSEQEEMKVLHNQTAPDQSAKTVACPETIVHTSKFKRRKKQHKKVVVQVRDDGLSSDLWAWRKYGQKPIKGSPYPRSYYKCSSSSKGCPARKQVEQSFSDPGMFTITYSAEHNHSQPTHRSCLAGTNRQRFPSPKRTSSADSCVTIAKEESGSSPTSDMVRRLSKTSPLMPPFEEILTLQQSIAHERIDGIIDDQMVETSNCNDFVMPDDFFAGLEDFDGLISNSGFYNCSMGLENFDGPISNSGFYNFSTPH